MRGASSLGKPAPLVSCKSASGQDRANIGNDRAMTRPSVKEHFVLEKVVAALRERGPGFGLHAVVAHEGTALSTCCWKGLTSTWLTADSISLMSIMR
jgi:hypothetical protein